MTVDERIFFLLAFAVVIVVVAAVPAYVVGLRRQVRSPGVAFVPYVGPYIVFLRSMGITGWASLFLFVPLGGLLFVIWLSFAMPNRHGRTRLWGLALLVLPVVGLYFYAFTVSRDTRPRDAGLAGYHVPAGYGRHA